MIRAESCEESSVSPFRETSIERRKMVERVFTSVMELMRSSHCCWRIHYFPLSTLINIIYSLLRTCFLITGYIHHKLVIIISFTLVFAVLLHQLHTLIFQSPPSNEGLLESGASPVSSYPSSQASASLPFTSTTTLFSSTPCHSHFTPDIPPPPPSEYYQEIYTTAVSPSNSHDMVPRIENC